MPTSPVHQRPMPDLPGVRHRYVDVPGVRLHVAEAGHGEPLLLLHGFPQHWLAWSHLVPILEDDFRLVMPDLRGFGWSDAPRAGYCTPSRVADLLALMDTLEIERAGVVGHEWGGWTGFHACIAYPERFTGLLALNAVHPWPLHRNAIAQAWRYWYTAFLEPPFLGRTVLRHWPSFTRFLLGHGVVDGASWSESELVEYVESARAKGSSRAAEALHGGFALHDLTALALNRYHRTRLTVPALVLAGERDFALSPRTLKGGERFADDLRTRVVAGAGHFLAQERPELVAQAVHELFGQR